MDSRFDAIEKRFQDHEEKAEILTTRINSRLDRLQHVMQQSSLVMKAGANGEETGEREEDAAVS